MNLINMINNMSILSKFSLDAFISINLAKKINTATNNPIDTFEFYLSISGTSMC